MKRLTQVLTAIAILATTAATAGADEYRSINSQALRVKNKSRQLLNESRRYRNTPSYDCLCRDLEQLADLGVHIRELARREASIFHLEGDLAEMDRLFHHIQGHYEQINREVAHGYGHINGCTARTWTLLRQLEEAIHCMQRDVAAIRARVVAYNTPTIRAPQPVRAPAIYGPQPVRYQTNYYNSYARPLPPQTGCPNATRGGYGNGFGGQFGNGYRGFDDRGGITLGNENFRIRFNF